MAFINASFFREVMNVMIVIVMIVIKQNRSAKTPPHTKVQTTFFLLNCFYYLRNTAIFAENYRAVKGNQFFPSVNSISAKPFVKWVGGKGQLLSQFEENLPKELYHDEFTYIEPFVGGGAMLFFMLQDNVK